MITQHYQPIGSLPMSLTDTKLKQKQTHPEIHGFAPYLKEVRTRTTEHLDIHTHLSDILLENAQ